MQPIQQLADISAAEQHLNDRQVAQPSECFKSNAASNNSQCQITRIRAIARARSREVSYAGVYLFLGLGLSLIIPTSRANLVLRVVWQCDIFGITPVVQGRGNVITWTNTTNQTDCSILNLLQRCNGRPRQAENGRVTGRST